MIPSRVVADEREKTSGVPEELTKLNVRVYFNRLPVADYVLNPEVAVERKSVRDLVSSVYDSRIFYQAAKLAASFAKPYLFVEGDSTEVEGLVRSLKSYYGAIAKVTIAYGLRVIYTANPRETATAIAELIANIRAKPPTRMPSEVAPKAKSLSAQQIYLVSSLPGVGRKRAEMLLLKYLTPRRVMSLSPGELAMTGGIGWKRAEKIKKALDSKYSKADEVPKQTRLEQ